MSNEKLSSFEVWYNSYDTRTPQSPFDKELARKAWDASIAASRQYANEWRKLALQFDSHRMQAIGHLKAIVGHLPDDMQSPIRNFLSATPDTQASGEPIYQIMAIDDDDNPSVRNLWMDVSHESYQSVVGDAGIRSRIVYKK